MARADQELAWVPVIDRATGPLYRAIAEALERDLRAGRVAPGTRLPPQRVLAARLGIDFTTVTRAYAEAARRGLVEGRVGQGTFVRARPAPEPRTGARMADLRMNLPPLPAGRELRDRIRRDFAAFGAVMDMELLLRYQQAGGSGIDREAGVAWLAGRLAVPPERVLVCTGAQGALLALLSLLCEPGDLVCCEALTYPGFRSLAAHLRLRVAGLAMDRHGLLPDAFEEACQRQRPRALYCIPTLHNPTTATLPPERREALVAIARRHGVPIIEDDAYGALPLQAPPPLAALGPEIVHHIAGLAKCVSPSLRIAYLAVPEARQVPRLMGAMRATMGMAPPLTAALATRWIGNGTAAAILAGIRAETAARHAIAMELLPAGLVAADPSAFHLWLRLPEEWTRGELMARLGPAGIGAVGSETFAVSAPPEALRLALGAPDGHGALRAGLGELADLLAEPPAMSSLIV
ncbi:aminotransferase-like domain-containing protein [Roseomonas marmotae]|uniref:PLP-dependent aminotransferase family protein n=1 Tax=Roseomonas marmotae TaxID=2768161 RepID=A0ABS3KAP3_9PROT|nr:PLP-dependent aminotransferase family protein [Roseomonas marmotae]MBO1074544.1 PLP-dependent aminotransferase family protein [Roseomonas marmotae]QTI81577.1 PLP-dependent aminotransferase family protein [Roseomonas marmotae]